MIHARPPVVSGLALAAALLAACQQAPQAPPAPADPVQAGFRLFNDPALSGDGRTACASCHPRGGHTNNKTYVGLEVVPDGQADGRSTPLLWGIKDTGPYAWAGGKSLQENIKGIIVNRMKGAEPSADRLAALEAYLGSLEFPANPNLNADGTPSDAAPAAARRGHAAFLKASCNSCHVPPVFTKTDNEDIGSGGSFNVPSLRGVSGTAPYFHDGRHPTLRALVPAKLEYLKALGATDTLKPDEIEDLLAYLAIL